MGMAASDSTRWMAKQRPCRPGGTLLCHSESFEALITGRVRKKMKPAAVTSTNDGARPCAARASPASREKPSTPLMRFFMPPDAAISTPPSSRPAPPIDICTPSRAGSAIDSTSGVMVMAAMPNRKLQVPNTSSRPNRLLRSRT